MFKVRLNVMSNATWVNYTCDICNLILPFYLSLHIHLTTVKNKYSFSLPEI